MCPAGLSHLRVPQDHDVQEDRIFLLSLLMAEMGVHSVAYAFPRVHIITTAVDKRVNEEFHIIPGIGEGDQGVLHPLAGASSPRGTLGAMVHSGAAVPSPCPFLCQVTLETDTLAPMALRPGVRATAWTAELAGHRSTGQAGCRAGPHPCPRRGPELCPPASPWLSDLHNKPLLLVSLCPEGPILPREEEKRGMASPVDHGEGTFRDIPCSQSPASGPCLQREWWPPCGWA